LPVLPVLPMLMYYRLQQDDNRDVIEQGGTGQDTRDKDMYGFVGWLKKCRQAGVRIQVAKR
jgi:hypothetical protein